MIKRNLLLIFLTVLLLFPYNIEAAVQKKLGSDETSVHICNNGEAKNNYLH